MRTATLHFSDSGGSLNGPDLFTEVFSCWNPYQAPIHWIASPLFTENPFFSLKSVSSHPLPKNRLWFFGRKTRSPWKLQGSSFRHRTLKIFGKEKGETHKKARTIAKRKEPRKSKSKDWRVREVPPKMVATVKWRRGKNCQRGHPCRSSEVIFVFFGANFGWWKTYREVLVRNSLAAREGLKLLGHVSYHFFGSFFAFFKPFSGASNWQVFLVTKFCLTVSY